MSIIGWDIGGAHVKACRLRQGEVLDVAQWPCALWQGLDHLEQALAAARERWPGLESAVHAVTMTGEMADLFADRQDGVQRIAALLAERLGAGIHFYAGDAGWYGPDQVAQRWAQIASANWLASARHTALVLDAGDALLVDIGSTTTDLIALRQGRVLTLARTDAQRLASGELVYQGVVRTPLCALARRIAWRGEDLNVMNEFFATTADVYRLCGELPAAHDQQPAADNAGKDVPATQQRLARMIGLDAREGTANEWLDFARAWRRHQLAELREQVERVKALHGLADDATLVSAGCGAFLVRELAGPASPCLSYAGHIARLAPDAVPGSAAWVQVCAPSVAVATLFEREHF